MKNKSDILALGLVGVTAISAVVLVSDKVLADTDVTSRVSVTVSESCSMTGNVDTAHSATIMNGTYTENIGKTTLKAFCNDSAGFSIYAVGYTGNIDGNNTMVGATTGHTILTGTATTGNKSQWAMKVSASEDGYGQENFSITNGFNNFSAVPSKYTRVASYSATTDRTLGSNLETTYSAYIGPTQAADTYTGQVKYILVHPTNATAPKTSMTFETAFINSGATKQSGYYKMQDMTSSICSSVDRPTNTTDAPSIQLVDTRDNKLYWVSKLKDGKCWMTQNLDLDLSSSTTLTSEKSNVSSWTPANSTIVGNAKNSTSVSAWGDSSDVPYSYDPGSYYSGDGVGSVSSFTAINCTASSNGGNNCHYHVGNYYNWAAAVASNNANSITYTTSNSICPKGWRLPSGNYGDFYLLNNAYGGGESSDSVFLAKPLWFVRTGYLDEYKSLHYVGVRGIYWSRTATASDRAGLLYFYNTFLGTYGNNGKRFGTSVRCVAQ